MEVSFFIQVVINGLVLGLYYVLIASGFTLIFGIVRIFNFAHGEIYMFGAYFTYFIVTLMGWNYWLGVVAAAIGTSLMGLFFNYFVYKPVRRMMYASFMVAMGLSLALPPLALIIFGERERHVPTVFHGIVNLIGATISLERLAIIISCTIIIVSLHLFVGLTQLGREMRAVAQDPEAASLLGINVERVCAITFVIASALAGLSAAIVAPAFKIDPFMGTEAIFNTMVVVILGGLGSITGALVGGLTLGFIHSFGISLLGYSAYMFGWIIVVILLLFRPTGLFGKEE